MKKTLFFILISASMISLPAWSHKKHDHKHKHGHKHAHKHDHSADNLSAHVHGEVNLSLAVDGQQMAIEIKAPAESLLGYEHAPENDKERAKWTQLQNDWTKNLWGAFTFPEGFGCSAGQQEIQLKVDDGHADIEASALVDCQKPLASREMKVKMMEKFERIQVLKMEVLPSNQKAYTRELKRATKDNPAENLGL